MTDYEYDEDLPYVVEREGDQVARFAEQEAAEHFASQRYLHRVIDTTPKPRVPEDAKFVTWPAWGTVFTARQTQVGNWDMNGSQYSSLEDLPGVTPETVFTVLDERKSDD